MKLTDLNKLQLWGLISDDAKKRKAMFDLKIKATGIKEVVDNRLRRDGVVEGNLDHVTKEQIAEFIDIEFEKEEEPKKEVPKKAKVKKDEEVKKEDPKPASKKSV